MENGIHNVTNESQYRNIYDAYLLQWVSSYQQPGLAHDPIRSHVTIEEDQISDDLSVLESASPQNAKPRPSFGRDDSGM